MVSKLNQIRKIKKRSFQTIFFSTLLAILTIAGITFLLIANWQIVRNRTELQARIEAMRSEIQDLEAKNQKLKVQMFQTDDQDYWERKMREQGYKKPGEEVAVILPPANEAGGEEERARNFWQKLLEKIKFW